jgi:serine/threonine-protein kinase
MNAGRVVLVSTLVSALVSVAVFFLLHTFVASRMSVPVEVPPLHGLSPDQARALLEPRGLLLVLDGEQADEKVAPGTVCDQRPLGGSRLPRNAEVHATLAKPFAAVTVPPGIGLTVDAARSTLAAMKLKAGRVSEAASDTVAKGLVVSSTPGGASEVKPDTMVDLVVSAGPSTQAIPSVVGKRMSTAKQLLEKVGFGVGATKHGSNDDYDEGVVISQNPTAGSQASPGVKVDLTVND